MLKSVEIFEKIERSTGHIFFVDVLWEYSVDILVIQKKCEEWPYYETSQGMSSGSRRNLSGKNLRCISVWTICDLLTIIGNHSEIYGDLTTYWKIFWIAWPWFENHRKCFGSCEHTENPLGFVDHGWKSTGNMLKYLEMLGHLRVIRGANLRRGFVDHLWT